MAQRTTPAELASVALISALGLYILYSKLVRA